MGSRQIYEDKQDTLEWNKQIKRAINRYNIGNKQEESLEILDLVDKQISYDYELDGVILDEIHIDFIETIENLLKGKVPEYRKPQNKWNEELSQALSEGELIKSIALMQIGKKLAYVKNVKCISENAEYLSKLNVAMTKIKRQMDRNEER